MWTAQLGAGIIAFAARASRRRRRRWAVRCARARECRCVCRWSGGTRESDRRTGDGWAGGGGVGRRRACERDRRWDAARATRQPPPPAPARTVSHSRSHSIYANHAPGHSVGPRPQAAAAAAKHAAVILSLPRVTPALRAHPRPGIIFPIPQSPSRRLSNTATVTSLSHPAPPPTPGSPIARSLTPRHPQPSPSRGRPFAWGGKLYFYIFWANFFPFTLFCTAFGRRIVRCLTPRPTHTHTHDSEATQAETADLAGGRVSWAIVRRVRNL